MKQHIAELEIQGFRSLNSVHLRSLRSVNLIVGPNSSGKTSLLQALMMFCLDGDASKLGAVAPPETDETDIDSIQSAVDYLFHTVSGKRQNELVVSGTANGLSRSMRFRRLTPSTDDEQGASTGWAVPESIKVKDRSPVDNKSFLAEVDQVRKSSSVIYEMLTTYGPAVFEGRFYLSPVFGPKVEMHRPGRPTIPAVYRKSIVKPDRDLPPTFDAVAESDRPRLIRMLQRIDPLIEAVRIGVGADGSPVLRAVHRDLGNVPIALLGDAVMFALQYAVLACQKVSVVMADEFDASLHVNTLADVSSFFKEQAESGVQFFLTTHRADTVAAFVRLMDTGWQDLAVIQMSKRGSAAHARVFEAEELRQAWRDLGLDLRVPL